MNLETSTAALFAGAYNHGDNIGLYLLQPEAGSWRKMDANWPELNNCTWLSVPQSGSSDYLLAVEENGDGKGALVRFWPQQSRLERLPLGTDAPCHLLQLGDWILAANYSPGLLSCVKVEGDKMMLAAELEHTQLQISGKESWSHIHQTVLSPDGQELAVVDLGRDRVYLYDWPQLRDELNALGAGHTARLRNRHRTQIELAAGDGPRHLCYDSHNALYLLNELGAKLQHYHKQAGQWELVESISVGEVGEDVPSGIVLSPDEQLLVTAIRGNNTVRTFARNISTGALEAAEVLDSGGTWPRSVYWLDNDTLLVCNEHSGQLQTFMRDGLKLKTGARVDGLPGLAAVTRWEGAVAEST